MLIRNSNFKQMLEKDRNIIVLIDADGVPNNIKLYPRLIEEKKHFLPHRMTAGKKEICDKFKKEGFNCHNLCEVCFRGYNIKPINKKRSGILNIAPARIEHDKSRRIRNVHGVDVIEYGRIGFKITEIMSESSVGVINGRNNTTLSMFDAFANGLPVLLPKDICITPEYLLTKTNHRFYEDEASFKKGIEILSNVNKEQIVEDFLSANKKEITKWKTLLKVPANEQIKIIRL